MRDGGSRQENLRCDNILGLVFSQQGALPPVGWFSRIRGAVNDRFFFRGEPMGDTAPPLEMAPVSEDRGTLTGVPRS